MLSAVGRLSTSDTVESVGRSGMDCVDEESVGVRDKVSVVESVAALLSQYRTAGEEGTASGVGLMSDTRAASDTERDSGF